MIVKRITVGADSRQEANDVAVHQNDIGRDQKDRKVVFVGEGQYEGTEECAPLFYVAVAETEEAMKEMVEEFIREVPTLLVDVGQAPERG